MSLTVQWIGRRPYREVWRLQRLRRQGIIDGHAPDTLWLLEHEPVITFGLRWVEDLPSPTVLAGAHTDVVRVERGGLATWHGPGQLVGYYIADLQRQGLVVRTMVHGIEQGIIDWLVERGVPAGLRPEYPGVWVGRDKICAVGLHVRHGVSMHGFALNLCPDLRGFSFITPCGITDGGVTSLEVVQGRSPAPHQVADSVGAAVARGLHRSGARDRVSVDTR